MQSIPPRRAAGLAALLLTLAVCAPSPVVAHGGEPVTGDRGTDMAVDLVLVRPLGIAASVIGAAGFVLALPFTVASGSTSETACEWIGAPLDYTFRRPLGDFDHRSPRRCTAAQ